MNGISRIIVTLSVLWPYATSGLKSDENSQSNNQKIELSSPEHVGLAHTQIIQNLEQIFHEKLPQNDLQYLHAISLEMRRAACLETDVSCNSNIVRRTIEIEPGPPPGKKAHDLSYIQSILPREFDPEISTAIEDLLLSATLADFNNPRDVLKYMNSNMNRIKHSETIENEHHRMAGIIAYSVGIESAKQWAEILQDPENPFHKIRNKEHHKNDPHRNLQSFGNMSPEEVQEKFVVMLQADILGAVTGAVNSVFDSEFGKTMMQFSMEEASIASLKSFKDNFITLGTVTEVVGGECSFPNAFWCNLNLGAGESSEEEDCMFPNSPLCAGNNGAGSESINNFGIGNNEEGGEDGTGNGESGTSVLNNVAGIIQGVIENGGTGGSGSATNFDPCLIPNNPLCNGPGNETSPNNEGGETASNGGGSLTTVLGSILGNGAGGAGVDNNGAGLPNASGGDGSLSNIVGGNGAGGAGALALGLGAALGLAGLGNGAGNIMGSLNGGGLTVFENEDQENEDEDENWKDDDDEWTQALLQTSASQQQNQNIQNVDPNTSEFDNVSQTSSATGNSIGCPFPNSPLCQLTSVTTEDGQLIECLVPNSPLCQLAQGRLKESQLPRQKSKKRSEKREP